MALFIKDPRHEACLFLLLLFLHFFFLNLVNFIFSSYFPSRINNSSRRYGNKSQTKAAVCRVSNTVKVWVFFFFGTLVRKLMALNVTSILYKKLNFF